MPSRTSIPSRSAWRPASPSAAVPGRRGRGIQGRLAVRAVPGHHHTARLLLLSHFGITAGVFPVLTFGAIFKSLGLSSAIIHVHRVTEKLLSTVFYVHIAMGVLLTTTVALLAAPLAALFDIPALTSVLALASLIFVLNRAPVTIALLERAPRFKQIAVVETVCAALGIATTIVAAALGASPYSLVLGPLVDQATRSRRLMTDRGHCHTSATVAVARKLVERTWTVLRRGEPYQLRDLNGRPVTERAAKQLIAAELTVDDAVRSRPAQRRNPPTGTDALAPRSRGTPRRSVGLDRQSQAAVVALGEEHADPCDFEHHRRSRAALRTVGHVEALNSIRCLVVSDLRGPRPRSAGTHRRRVTRHHAQVRSPTSRAWKTRIACRGECNPPMR